MIIDRATPATQNGHDKPIRYRPSHDSNLQQAQTFFLFKYGYIKQHHWRERFIVGILCLPLCLLNKAHIQGTETLSC